MRRSVLYRAASFGLAAFAFLAVPNGAFAGFGQDKDAGAAGALQAFTGEKAVGWCRLRYTDVRADITGSLSRVTVRQDFRNSFRDPIEAVYKFPLPHDAAVDDMTIRVGTRSILGLIKRREEAKEIYDDARARGKLAALLDQERPNIFTQQIANILPGQDVEVTISYVETLKYENGSYRFVFPMVVGPRYIPGSPAGKQGGGWSQDTTRVPDASRVTPPVTPPGTRAGHDISIEVNIEAGVPLANIRSTQHQVATVRRDSHSATVRLADLATIPNQDFILSYEVAGAALRDGLVAHKPAGDGYFMLILQPPLKISAEQAVPKELVFVLDTSGSMSGFPVEKAKETMKLALDALYERDTFNLITFSGDTRILFPEPVPATRANLALAQEFLASRRGSGGTEMMKAVRAALDPSDSQNHVRIVCFMTDGFVGNDMEIISEVQRHPNARVFAFGIGTSVNRFLLDRMAGEGRGAVEYVTLANSADAAARRFHERVRNPLLTDIKLEWTGSPVKDLYPERVPDLFSAEPVVVCGRYSRGGTALLRLSGRSGDGAFERNLRIPLPEAEPEHDVLAKLWARRRIDALMAQDYSGMQHGRPRADIEESIVALGLEHRLMTQFTSFVAVEERVVTEGGKTRKVQVPVEMPEGVRYEGVFGAAAVGGVVGGVAGGIVASLPGGNSSLSAPLPPPPSADAPVRIGGQVQEAKLIRRVEPVIPELARKAAISAGVWLEVNVDAAGNVTGARVLRGHPLLDDAAIAAVKQWKYSPTLLNGSPVPVVVTVTFPFKAAVQARLDPAIALLIARALSGAAPAAGEFNFVRDGKAEVELTVDASSLRLREQLVALGFEIVSWPHGSATVVGRIPVQKAAALLDLDAVRFIAPR